MVCFKSQQHARHASCHSVKEGSQHMKWTELNWPATSRPSYTTRLGAFIGNNSRQRHYLIGCSETRPVSAQRVLDTCGCSPWNSCSVYVLTTSLYDKRWFSRSTAATRATSSRRLASDDGVNSISNTWNDAIDFSHRPVTRSAAAAAGYSWDRPKPHLWAQYLGTSAVVLTTTNSCRAMQTMHGNEPRLRR